MSEHDIIHLESKLQLGKRAFIINHNGTLDLVNRIGLAPRGMGIEHDQEPSKVAYIGNEGKYVALYNVDPYDVVIATLESFYK